MPPQLTGSGIIRADLSCTLIALIGTTADAFITTLEIESPDELIPPPKNEVEKLFVLPVSYFERNEPERYQVRPEIQSSYMDQNGEKVFLLPTEALNLPERYAESWGFRHHRILVFRTRGDACLWYHRRKNIRDNPKNQMRIVDRNVD